MKSLTVVVLLSTLAVCCMVSSVDGFKCYKCGTTSDNACTSESYGTVFEECASCAILTTDGKTARGCGSNKVGFEGCVEGNGVQSCECLTDLCNTEVEVVKKNLPPGIKCYECFGDECHKEEGATKSGCGSCLKVTIIGQIQRQCLPLKTDKTGCETAQGSTACFCETDLCNAAAEVASSRLLIGCVLAAMLVVCLC